MAEYIERETAVKAVMAAKWVDGSDGAMAMEIVASQAAADVATWCMGGGTRTKLAQYAGRSQRKDWMQ